MGSRAAHGCVTSQWNKRVYSWGLQTRGHELPHDAFPLYEGAVPYGNAAAMSWRMFTCGGQAEHVQCNKRKASRVIPDPCKAVDAAAGPACASVHQKELVDV